jgi:protein arginine kinase activator
MYDLFSDFENFFNNFDAFMQPVTYQEAKKCPVCGHTWSDFRRTGRFGCSECYKTFRAPVTETIKQIHATTKHTGKIPSKSGSALKKKRQYEALKAQLQEAVKNEDYETAAKLHKQIRAMENDK